MAREPQRSLKSGKGTLETGACGRNARTYGSLAKTCHELTRIPNKPKTREGYLRNWILLAPPGFSYLALAAVSDGYDCSVTFRETRENLEEGQEDEGGVKGLGGGGAPEGLEVP